MTRAILFVVGGFALVGLGFALGTAMDRPPTAPTGPAPPSPPSPPELDEWTYPGAVRGNEVHGYRDEKAGILLHLTGYAADWSTADDYGAVVKHYAERLQLGPVELDKFPHLQTGRTELSPTESSAAGMIRGSADPGPYRLHVLFRRAATYAVTVVVSRGEGEKRTHITLLYDVK